MESASAPHESSIKRFASTVYRAQAGTRSPLLDGPWWLGIAIAVTFGVLAFVDSPWKWFAAPVAAALY